MNGETQLKLQASFVEGFDTSVFEIEADDRVLPHWEIVNDRMLIPIKVNLRVIDSSSGTKGLVVNIQLGLVVVRIDKELQFKKISNDGLQRLDDALPQPNEETMKALLETSGS